MATAGTALFAPVEYALTLWAYPGPVEGKLRLAALTATLSLWLWLALALGLTVAVLLRRGLFAVTPLDGGIRRGVPRVWAALVTAGIVGAFVQVGAAWAIIHYREPQLTAALVATLALGGLVLAVPLYRA
ncbi:MAG TPA: hypothetical protein VLT45_13915, partial [Kofleriaceae bacterium]|nr:hypothetical protein [Kofleriaceae bacterium]